MMIFRQGERVCGANVQESCVLMCREGWSGWQECIFLQKKIVEEQRTDMMVVSGPHVMQLMVDRGARGGRRSISPFRCRMGTPVLGDGQGGKSTHPQELLWEFALGGHRENAVLRHNEKQYLKASSCFLLNVMHKIRIMS